MKLFNTTKKVIAILGIAIGIVFGQTDITANFTDTEFRKEVYKAIGKDRNSHDPIYDSDVKKITVLDAARQQIIQSLAGIEHFTELTELYCNDNKLTSLDVSKNTKLTRLHCSNNRLTELDVSKNTALNILVISDNDITKIDVSKNTALTQLWCIMNELTELDVSKNTMLTLLNCNRNKLTALDVSKNKALKTLHCEYNYFSGEDKIIGLNAVKARITNLPNGGSFNYGLQKNP